MHGSAGTRAALFDLDGVLIDTDAGVRALWRQVLGHHGVLPTDDELATHAIGCSPDHTVDVLLATHSAGDRTRALAAVREAEPRLAFTVVPGAAALLRAVAALVPVAVVTGASRGRLEAALDALGCADAVSATVAWGEAAHGKPAPDVYLLAATRLGVEATRCVVVEDAPAGVRAAVAAGAACVGVGAADALLAAGATATVGRLDELSVTSTPSPAILAGTAAFPLS